MRGTQVWSLGREDPLEKEMATHSSILAWKIPRTEERGRLQFMKLQRVGHDVTTSLTHSLTILLCLSSQSQAPREILTWAIHGPVSRSWLCAKQMLHGCACVIYMCCGYPPTEAEHQADPSWKWGMKMCGEGVRRQPNVRTKLWRLEETDLMGSGGMIQGSTGQWPNGVVTDAGPQSLSQGIQTLP